jgi:hypothetical protein
VTKAFLLSPLVAPVLYFLGSVFLGGGTGWEAKDFFSLLMVVLFIATPVSYLATTVFGFPYLQVLRRFGFLSSLSLTAGGIFFGVLSFLFFWGSLWGPGFVFSLSGLELVRLVGIGAILGGSVAFCFAYISGITSPWSRPGETARRFL